MTAVEQLTELVRRTTSSLPGDVVRALERALGAERKGSSASVVISTILENCALAAKGKTPLCQDTGTLSFYVDEALRGKVTRKAVNRAVAEATRLGLLRRNCIDTASGRSIDDNCGEGALVLDKLHPELVKALAEYVAARADDPKKDKIVVLSVYAKRQLRKYGRLNVITMEELAASCL